MSTRDEKIEAFTKQLMSEGWPYTLAFSRARAAYTEDRTRTYHGHCPPPSAEFKARLLEEHACRRADREGCDPEEQEQERAVYRRKTRMCTDCGAVTSRESARCHSCEMKRRHEAGVYDDCERNTVFANPRRGA